MEWQLEKPVTAVWVWARKFPPALSSGLHIGQVGWRQQNLRQCFYSPEYLRILALLIRQIQRLWDIVLRFSKVFWQKCSKMKKACLQRGSERTMNKSITDLTVDMDKASPGSSSSFSTPSGPGANFRPGFVSHPGQLWVPSGPIQEGRAEPEEAQRWMGPGSAHVGINLSVYGQVGPHRCWYTLPSLSNCIFW